MQDHLTDELREQSRTFNAFKKDGWGGGSKYVKALDDTLTTIAATYDELFLSIRARSCAFMLLCAFPGWEAGKRARLQDIQSALATFSPSGEATMALDRSLREKLGALGSIGTTGLLLDREHAFLERIVAAKADVLENMRIRPQLTDETAAALSFDVKLESGRPVAIRLADAYGTPALYA